MDLTKKCRNLEPGEVACHTTPSEQQAQHFVAAIREAMIDVPFDQQDVMVNVKVHVEVLRSIK